MAAKAKTETNDGGSAVRSNGYDPEAVRRFVSRIENLEAEIELEKAEFKEKTTDPLKADIDAVVAEAKSAGISKKALKAKLKERAMRRKAEALRAKLDAMEQDNFDNLSQALGDFGETGLGTAALAAAARNGSSKGATA